MRPSRASSGTTNDVTGSTNAATNATTSSTTRRTGSAHATWIPSSTARGTVNAVSTKPATCGAIPVAAQPRAKNSALSPNAESVEPASQP